MIRQIRELKIIEEQCLQKKKLKIKTCSESTAEKRAA
jgi:hypothetical protein